MLAEALLYARARLGGQSNPYGHLTELVGIWARHRRQRQAWSGHLARARGLCLQAAEACARSARRTALVLGGGALLDVPLERLSTLFRRVVLADLAFLPGTLRLGRTLGNVDTVLADLSGCLDALPVEDALRAGQAQAPQPDLSLGLPDLDFVYSANLLSQLPLFPLTALRQRSPELPPEALDVYAASLVRAHLEALRRLPCPACLVTDTLERGLADQGQDYKMDLLFGVVPGLTGETWTWPLAPRGEMHPDLDVERVVLGVADARQLVPQTQGGTHG